MTCHKPTQAVIDDDQKLESNRALQHDRLHNHTLARARLCYDQHVKRVQTDK